MADLALAAGQTVPHPVSGVGNGHEQYTFEAAERIRVGQVYSFDANGKAVLAPASAPFANKALFVAIDEARQAGNAVTGIAVGLLDGYDLDALAYGAPIYVGNTGNLSDTAGTNSQVVGRVHPVSRTSPSGADKIVRVFCPK